MWRFTVNETTSSKTRVDKYSLFPHISTVHPLNALMNSSRITESNAHTSGSFLNQNLVLEYTLWRTARRPNQKYLILSANNNLNSISFRFLINSLSHRATDKFATSLEESILEIVCKISVFIVL
ncbi:hypothetical protein FR483_n348R [Paramecium bursaria Chlorella virus FR483]|uniref:Uncharacterized protein n348R n=1 Tax=Paramecium bursaria Chlorella virus FR483 TaxID=399781 RepID=A7J752_PBCVF|nr:hypothetical protein FR483_n348R [Paramecium bursaria Chlorella virus FR483]ABT15633.1 hypothetical protein FR483_n348R [Paramecium bursaria Chlorella virus FR483]